MQLAGLTQSMQSILFRLRSWFLFFCFSEPGVLPYLGYKDYF